MSENPSMVGMRDTRLVRLLSDLAVPNMAYSSGNFSQRLGALVDFKDSMRLSSFHDGLGRMDFEPGPQVTASGDLKQAILKTRQTLMQLIVEGFTTDAGPARLRLPMLDKDLSPDQLMSFEPYHRFYAAHQREFESRLQTLQLRVREALSQTSAELQRLAALDEVLRDVVVVQTRKSLAAIPQLLGKRFDKLLQEHRTREGTLSETWSEPDSWLDQFCDEMRELLLAELELRLMPIIGLLEAIEEEVTGK